jgi:ATP-dependent Clp protease adapter protein ClpS
LAIEECVTLKEILKYNIVDDPKQKRLRDLQRSELFESELNEILDRLGITFSEEFNLILHNDKNFMLHVVISLTEVCKLSNEKSLSVMKEAHTKGRAIVLNSNNIDALHYMRLQLVEKHGLTATLEKAE